VGRELLQDTPIQFYATATSGIDHVDTQWLAQAGIGFASAHGSNARAVAEWFVAALDHVGYGLHWAPLTIGVVGVGAVGTQVATMATRLGATVLCCDPPRARRGDDAPHGQRWWALAELLPKVDVLTFHVPLIQSGVDTTVHLLDEGVLDALPTAALVVNASRGAVIDTDPLLNSGHRAVLDVFMGEPDFDPRLVQHAVLATPHIAGHSLEGKLAGTRMIANAASVHFRGQPTSWVPPTLTTPPIHAETASAAIQQRTQILRCDYAIRKMASLPTGERGGAFRRFRRGFKERHEFHHGSVVSNDVHRILSRLGFSVLEPTALR
jgi:erythronate-4-phosphate dehydrogenase